MFKRLVHISRPLLWINTIGPALLGLWLTGDLWQPFAIYVIFWLLLPFNLLIYGLNDIADYAIDQKSSRKGGYQGARIKREEFKIIVIATVGLNLPFAIIFATQCSWITNLFIWSYAIVFVAYSVPPIRFKARPFLDSLANAAYAFPVAIMPLALGKAFDWNALGALMSWSVAKQAYDAIQDIPEDRQERVFTTPVTIGVRWTLVWCFCFWLGSSYFMLAFSTALAVFNFTLAMLLLVPVWLKATPATAASLYKFSIAYPYVVGGTAGVCLAWSVFTGLTRW